MHQMPDYVLISELLGFGTGTVLSIHLVLLVRRASQKSPGTPLLAFSALLWNVVGLMMNLLVLSGLGDRSLPVSLARATFLSGGALFPISFLKLWSRPHAPGSREEKLSRWLYRVAVVDAAVIILLLFLCPFLSRQVQRMAMYTVPVNASVLLTIGALTQVRGRLSATADRIYLTLTLFGVWGSTVAMVTLDQVRLLPPRLEAFLVIAKEQSPFLAILGALFFFARFRSSDVLIKQSLRVIAAMAIGLWTCVFLADSLPGLANRLSAYPTAARTGLAAATIAALLLIFALIDWGISLLVDNWLLRQPDYGASLQQLWDEIAPIDSDREIFASVDRIISEVLDVTARVLPREQVPGIETHAGANVGQLWELCCEDPSRRALPGYDVDLLVPVRAHGSITHIIAVAPGSGRHSLLNSDLRFLENVAGQVGRRLESLAHERERIERESREAKLRQLAAQAELKALRAQINPHFLFNSLNTVADLIVTDPAKAETMTVLLAKVFRHVLAYSDRQLTRVAEEMDFLRTYLRIEEVRFGDRLRVSMTIDPVVSSDSIPSLILQPVVENAIKHGLASKVGDGNLSILADRHGDFLRLAVEDDGVGPESTIAEEIGRKGNGVGLKIIAERLRTLYDGRASLSIEKAAISGSRVTILIPRGEAVA